MPSLLTDALKKSTVNKSGPKRGRIGQLRRIGNHEAVGDGWNAGISTGQVSTITFAAPGTLAAAGKVTLNFLENRDCDLKILELNNPGTTALSLATLVIDAISGTGSAIGTIKAPGFEGYTAVAGAVANTVVITGPAGIKFTITPGQFGLTTAAGVVNPAVPTIALTTSAVCAGLLPYAVAVVTNPRVAELAYPRQENSSLAQDPGKVLYLPAKDPTEAFAGITIREPAGELSMPDGCCDDADCASGYDCHSCAHFLKPCCHDQEIVVQLEPLAAGVTIPVSLVDMPIYYRVTTEATRPQLGSLSIKTDVTADPNRRLAGNTAFQFVISEVIDSAQLIVSLKVSTK